MVGSSRQSLPSWIGLTATRKVELDRNMVKAESFNEESSNSKIFEVELSFGERAFAAAGAAVISAIIVNPLDVAKTRLQAQAAGVPYDRLCQTACSGTNTMLQERKYMPSSAYAPVGSQPTCSPDCTRYRGTFDVLYKVIRQEGFSRLWRGTNASLALAVPSVGIYMPLYDILRNYMEEVTSRNAPAMTPYVPLFAGSLARSTACITCYPVELARTRMQAFQHSQANVKPPGVLKTLIGVVSPVKTANNNQAFQSFRILWTGLGGQLARDVPFSAVCWSSLEPLRRKILSSIGEEASASSILGANFCAGFVAGSLAAATTCPLDVARTRRQIEGWRY
ncbi:mitochondrial carrier protein MTM1 isoform X3 [Sesamum indicum]|uniref:Mitochondrial carrier protein MTM1 isoform X3 n=1 Tax=Sesamum indicum TaxID=4182 RepID=A0A8M8VBH9_SESIN|nr:mitochondrial carrier protein MTM1 isoform X3 [Sesamum indicum]